MPVQWMLQLGARMPKAHRTRTRSWLNKQTASYIRTYTIAPTIWQLLLYGMMPYMHSTARASRRKATEREQTGKYCLLMQVNTVSLRSDIVRETS